MYLDIGQTRNFGRNRCQYEMSFNFVRVLQNAATSAMDPLQPYINCYKISPNWDTNGRVNFNFVYPAWGRPSASRFTSRPKTTNSNVTPRGMERRPPVHDGGFYKRLGQEMTTQAFKYMNMCSLQTIGKWPHDFVCQYHIGLNQFFKHAKVNSVSQFSFWPYAKY